MGRLLKIILSVLAAIILLVIIATIALPYFIDPNDFKPEIQSAVKENTGRDLEIKGDLKLSVFPWLGVSTGELILSNAPDFSEVPFAKINASQVKVKLLPLLSKKLEVSRIELKGLDLYLAKNKQGISNWDDLTQAKSTEKKEQQPQTTKDTKEVASPLAALALGGISIEQAHIIWDDQQAGQYTEIKDFNLTTSELVFDQPIDIELSLELLNKEPNLIESLNLSTEVTINEQLDIFNLTNINLKSLTTGKAIPGETLTTNLQSNIAINLAQQTISISGLKLDLDDVTEEKLKIKLITDAAINLSNQAITTTGFKITADRLMKDKLNVNLVADISTNLSQQTLSISELKLNAGDLNLSADIKGSQIIDNPILKGPINIAPINLAQFLKGMDIPFPEMKDSKALNNLSLKFNLLATKDSADINNLIVKLDDTNITGSAGVKNFDKLASKFNINVDSIDLDRYLPPKVEKKADATISTPASAAVATAQLFPVETLRKLNTDGQLSIGSLKINDLSMKGVNLKLNSKKGLLKTQQSIKHLYQGSYSGRSSVNVQRKTPQLTLDEKLSNIQIEPLLKAMKIERQASGLINATAKIQGRGNSTSAIKSSLAGNVDFSIKDSIIKGFNLQKIIDGGKLLIQGKALPAENKNDQTVFSVIKGSAQIKKGLVTNNDLLAESSKLRVKGKGTANLATDALNFGIDARLLKPNEKDKFKGIPLAVKIAGSFSEPSYQLDIESMVKAKYKDKIDKVVDDKILKKLDEKLGPGVGDALKSFF
ncbi:MAG: AsmA family protein [Methylococcales bacterium]|nr:AsmA family protein [Methylococcales bacterium]